MHDLGTAIREARKKRGMTQKRLAELLNVSDTIISKYEKGLATPPLDTLCKMASIFRTSLDELCGLDNSGSISVSGLTDAQQDILSQLTELFRFHERSPNGFSPEQYELIGKIIVEFAKR